MRRAALALALAALWPAGSAAETVAITGGRVVTAAPAGIVEPGTVVVSDGKVAAVGADIAVPAGARVVDASGMTVTPGLFTSAADLGLIEVRAVSETDDRASDHPRISAALDVRYALNPDSVLIPVARLGGVTSALSIPVPGGGGDRHLQFAGQAAVISLAAGGEMLVKPAAAMVLALGEAGAAQAGSSRGAAVAQLKATLDDVRHFMRRRADYDRGAARPYELSRADLEALVPVVRGEMPLLVTVHRASDILNVLALARAEGLDLILEGAAEGWRVASDIARAGVPVLVNPVENAPMSFETLGATLENAARLHRAGVTIAIEGNGAHRSRETRYNAGNAVAAGLPYEAAIAAITINPARIFGVADRLGSIEPGKQADLVLWDGDPLEPTTRPVAVYIHGAAQPMKSRQTELRDHYLPAIEAVAGASKGD